MRSLVLVLIVAFSSQAFSRTSLTAILSLKKGAEISKQDLKRLSRHHEIIKVSPLFTKAEKAVIKSIKADYLSQSWLVELKGMKSFDAVEKEIRRRGLPLNLDWNEMQVSTLDFTADQWGLSNQGQPQGVDLDPMLVYRVPGRAGEDVHYVPSPLIKQKIRVAVLDTGLDVNHPDLKDVVVRKESECQALEKYQQCLAEGQKPDCDKKWLDTSNPEVDQDKNGYPMDCSGWSVNGRPDPGKILGQPLFSDSMGHGTHVAGIIGAIRDNNIGVNGISSNVELLPVQVISTAKPLEPLKPLSVDLNPVENKEPHRREVTLGAMVARGVIYAIHSKAQVLNFSMGWPQTQDSEFMRAVVAEAQSRGIIIVAAAGNDSTRALLRPCVYPGVICVGSHNPDGAVSHFSNYGSGVDLFAPGMNILSTYPEAVRPVRFRKTLGYEFLSGTSQATPFVSGAVAELLARGIPAKDVLPRLILGSRPTQKAMPLTEGTPHSVTRTLPEDPLDYAKWGAGGLLDLQKSIKVSPQALILPLNREKIELPWDRKSRDLSFKFKMKNLWQGVPTAQVKITGNFAKPSDEAVRPQLVSLQPAQNYSSTWAPQEIREFVGTLRIEDTQNPYDSRIPADLDLSLQIQTAGQTRTSSISLEVTVELSQQTQAADISRIAVVGMPQGQTDIIPIDQYFDEDPSRREYLVTLQDDSEEQVWSLQMQNGKYVTRGGQKIKLEGDVRNVHMAVQARMDWDFDGSSDYVLGYVEDKTAEIPAVISPWSFHIFDAKMNLTESFKVDSAFAQMPAEIFWQKVGSHRMPAWVGPGKDPDKVRGLRDRWENPHNREAPEIRFYYLDENKKLKALQKHEGFHFIDVLQPTRDQQMEGKVPVLLAKNMGTEAKPSYIYEFAVAEVMDGQVENFRKIDFFGEDLTYRNILDTRVDRILSLAGTDEVFMGTFWFGEGKPRHQRLTTMDSQTLAIKDSQLGALRAQFDAALTVRGVFSNQEDYFAYVFTNSEIQLHHLGRNQVVQTSLDRYSFFSAKLAFNIYFPVTLRSSSSDMMLPSLVMPEGAGLNRGVKMLAPVFAYNGDVVELVSPARLRFKTDRKVSGCIPMETPVLQGKQGTSLDFYCQNSQQFLRANLKF